MAATKRSKIRYDARQGSGSVQAVTDALLKMVKLDIATLERAYRIGAGWTG